MKMQYLWFEIKETPLITDLPFKVSDTSIVILKGLPVLQCDNCRNTCLDDLVMNCVGEHPA